MTLIKRSFNRRQNT